MKGAASKNVGWRDRALWAGLGALGLSLYLWPALAAPVVLWSDSVRDLEWARAGVGISQPVPSDIHLAKPGYLLFLRGAMALAPPLGEARSVVLTQSLLLWISIAATAVYIACRKGVGVGLGLYVVLILFTRLRDASSAVMTESLTAALLLPFAAFVLFPPGPTRYGPVFAGIAAALIFAIRPNAGAIALALAVLAALPRLRPLALLLIAFVGVVAMMWAATRRSAGEDPWRGIGHPLLAASAEYYWLPSLGEWPEAASEKERGREAIRRARENWRSFFSRKGADTSRELLWRAFHGLFGTEFYDARWSEPYRRLDTVSRLLAPVLLFAAIAILAVLPFPKNELTVNVAAPLLLTGLVAQNLFLGSHPRYVLPFLPVLLVLACVGAASFRATGARKRVSCLVLFVALVGAAAWRPFLLDWEWGQVEAEGVVLSQKIPRGGLPERGPATFHARIAPAALPTSAHLDVYGPGPRALYTSDRDPARHRPLISFPLPQSLLDANRSASIELRFVSRGGYGPTDSLLFPVIPPPWRSGTRREGSDSLSPATGVEAGSLDWWAHEGGDAGRVPETSGVPAVAR